MNGLIKLSDHAPCYSSCKASRLRPGLGDTCSGHPLPPGLGAPAAVGSAPNPSEKSIFIGAGAVPGILPERAQVHALLGGGTRARPPGSFPGALPPLRGAARRVRPRHGAGLLSPFAHPHRTHLPEGHAPFREPRGGHVPKEGWRGSHFHPPSPTGPGTKRAPTCLWREQMTQRSGQRSRSGKCPEPITGSRALRSGGSSAVTYATRSPLALPGLSAAACALGQLPAYRFPPLLPPESPLRGWGPAG